MWCKVDPASQSLRLSTLLFIAWLDSCRILAAVSYRNSQTRYDCPKLSEQLLLAKFILDADSPTLDAGLPHHLDRKVLAIAHLAQDRQFSHCPDPSSHLDDSGAPLELRAWRSKLVTSGLCSDCQSLPVAEPYIQSNACIQRWCRLDGSRAWPRATLMITTPRRQAPRKASFTMPLVASVTVHVNMIRSAFAASWWSSGHWPLSTKTCSELDCSSESEFQLLWRTPISFAPKATNLIAGNRSPLYMHTGPIRLTTAVDETAAISIE